MTDRPQLVADTAKPARHHTDRQENGWLVCWCGYKAATAWAMSVHRKQEAGLLPKEGPDESGDQIPGEPDDRPALTIHPARHQRDG
jgi:hypothetical protein